MTIWPILISLFVGYFAVLSAMTIATQPLRLRLATLADAMAAEPRRSKEEKDHLDWMASSSASAAIGAMLPIAATFSLASAILGGRPAEEPALSRLESDPRYTRLTGYYMASVMACSPFAALLAIPIITIAAAVRAVRGDAHIVQSIEEPMRRASSTFQTC